tara:strand:+ start:972 stop:1304 length:333 start_codon:yes stop_codon:yes gene_type:complete
MINSKDEPLTKDEQMQAAGDLLKSGELLFMAVARDNGEVAVGVNALYESPTQFGLVLADMVSHIVKVYAKANYAPQATRSAILSALGEELDFPSGVPSCIEEAERVIPQA